MIQTLPHLEASSPWRVVRKQHRLIFDGNASPPRIGISTQEESLLQRYANLIIQESFFLKMFLLFSFRKSIGNSKRAPKLFPARGK